MFWRLKAWSGRENRRAIRPCHFDLEPVRAPCIERWWLTAETAPTMPLLARANQRVGRELGSRATQSEGGQNMICAHLSVALLIGLGANALLDWWWADPAAGAVIAFVAIREGREAWRGESACDGC
jgi:hypothetical protein